MTLAPRLGSGAESGGGSPSPLSRAAAEVLEAAVEEADAVDAVRLVDDDTSPEAARASQRMDKAIARRVEKVERFRALLRGEGEEGQDPFARTWDNDEDAVYDKEAP